MYIISPLNASKPRRHSTRLSRPKSHRRTRRNRTTSHARTPSCRRWTLSTCRTSLTSSASWSDTLISRIIFSCSRNLKGKNAFWIAMIVIVAHAFTFKKASFTLVAGCSDCHSGMLCCRELEIFYGWCNALQPVAGHSRFTASLNEPQDRVLY